MSRGFDRPLEELEAGREAAEDLLKPSKRDVAEAGKRADYCVYQMSLGYSHVENRDMRYMGVLRLENLKLELELIEMRQQRDKAEYDRTYAIGGIKTLLRELGEDDSTAQRSGDGNGN